MRVSFIVPCRDKAAHVETTVRSVLAQTFHPMEIVLSDQGSTDGTRDILHRLAAEYSGPNRIVLLDCPKLNRHGMAGLNEHLNWLNERIDGEIVIMCSADDIVAPNRAAVTVEGFNRPGLNGHPCPSYVLTRLRVEDPDGGFVGETEFPDRRTRWIGFAEALRHGIISRGSGAWSRALWDKHGPLLEIESQDIVVPVMALVEGGIYYVDEPVHTYINHVSDQNTGIEGRLRGATTDAEFAQLTELQNYHTASNWSALYRRLHRAKKLPTLGPDDHMALSEHLLISLHFWAQGRDALTMERIPPLPMRS